MSIHNKLFYIRKLCVLSILTGLTACTLPQTLPEEPPLKSDFEYVLGPSDVLDIFVWRNSDLSVNLVPVRPDGKLSAPLVEELVADGKTPKQLARDIERQLAKYIKDPFVTVIVRQFSGRLEDQIRIVGEVTTPSALPYRKNMSVLDVMIKVGGLTDYAAGDKAIIVRKAEGKRKHIPVYLQRLLKDGDISANRALMPGDTIIVPESWF